MAVGLLTFWGRHVFSFESSFILCSARLCALLSISKLQFYLLLEYYDMFLFSLFVSKT